MAYNGWENWETWNVALWIENDEYLYSIARECRSYKSFIEYMREIGITQTPDGVPWNSLDVEVDEINNAIWEGE